MTGLEVSVLGPVLVRRGGTDVDIGTLRHRGIVAALTLTPGQAVSSGVLIERIWGDDAPPSALPTLHGYIASLRRALEPDRVPRAPAQVLVTHADTYTLQISPDGVDEGRFETLIARARSLLDVIPDHLRPRVRPEGREAVESALDQVDEALGLWRGTPFTELGDDPVASTRRMRLESRRLMAQELRAVGQLALGLHDVVRYELEARTVESPLHERWWALRAVALARESRQAEALSVLEDLRAHLADELGVDPSPPLQALHAAILRQDPSVSGPPDMPIASLSAPRGAIRTTSFHWDSVGRDRDLAQLASALDDASTGRTTLITVTGEPGIGKSRLVAEAARMAAARGFTVAIGQCSQDDGAPPFWPWFSVLDALGAPFDPPDPGLEGGGLFRVRSDIVRAVRAATTERPLLLALEDLHWADASTLGVLSLLVESVTDRRLMVMATWRTPSQNRYLSGIAESFARRHAVRRELHGLDPRATGELFEQVAGMSLPDDRVAALHENTNGNPFFVVEFARLAGAVDAYPGDVIGSGPLPTSVADVTEQRLAGLPDVTRTVLRSAAVVGRSFDLETLGDVTRMRPDELLDAVEPAVAAGVLDEEDVEVFRFSHSLVRDVLCATMSSTRLARTHCLVAEILEQRPGREGEVAWHWRAAGPQHAARAWRAAAAAAAAASRAYGYDDAVELLEGAFDLLEADPDAVPGDELALLHQTIEVYRWTGMRPQLVVAVERGIAVARAQDDAEALARMAVQVTHRMLWRSSAYGAVNDVLVGALQEALEQLPENACELRSRVMASLAIEIQYVTSLADRQTLVAEAARLARASGDEALLCDVLLHEAVSTWLPATGRSRIAAVEEAQALADAVGDQQASVMAAVLKTVILAEMGCVDEMWGALAAARAAATAARMIYLELVCDELELAWQAAAGRWAVCEELLDRIQNNLTLMRRPDSVEELAVESTVDVFALRLWQGRALEALPELEKGIALGYPQDVFAVIALWRGGRRVEAKAAFRPSEMRNLLYAEMAFALPIWCGIAEAALYFSEIELARHAYERLAPYAGWSSGANGLFFGPVDVFLAMAAATVQDERAGRHAEDAAELLQRWALPKAQEWWAETRLEHHL